MPQLTLLDLIGALGPQKRAMYNQQFDPRQPVSQTNLPYQFNDKVTFWDRLLRPQNVQAQQMADVANAQASIKSGTDQQQREFELEKLKKQALLDEVKKRLEARIEYAKSQGYSPDIAELVSSVFADIQSGNVLEDARKVAATGSQAKKTAWRESGLAEDLSANTVQDRLLLGLNKPGADAAKQDAEKSESILKGRRAVAAFPGVEQEAMTKLVKDRTDARNYPLIQDASARKAPWLNVPGGSTILNVNQDWKDESGNPATQVSMPYRPFPVDPANAFIAKKLGEPLAQPQNQIAEPVFRSAGKTPGANYSPGMSQGGKGTITSKRVRDKGTGQLLTGTPQEFMEAWTAAKQDPARAHVARWLEDDLKASGYLK